jgi:hypothetical protein
MFIYEALESTLTLSVILSRKLDLDKIKQTQIKSSTRGFKMRDEK